VLDSIPEGSGSSKESKGEMGDQDKASKQQNGEAREYQEHGSSADFKKQDVKANGNAEVPETKRDQGSVRPLKSAKSIKDPSTSSANLEARAENGELYGAPADASRNPKTDDQPPAPPRRRRMGQLCSG